MTKFIAIDGHGGSGKSTLAQELAKELGAEIIHTDDFASFYNPINWWPLVIERVLEPVRQGATKLSYPRSKWWADHKPEPVVDQPVTEIMILEGVSALRKELREYIDFGVYVDTPKEICLERGLARDKGNEGKSDEEIVAMWDQWFENEDKYLVRDAPKEYADMVIDGTQPINEGTQRIKELISE